jgi:PmbA protein
MDFEDITEKAVAQGLKLGAQEVEAYLVRTKQSTIKVNQGEIESLNSADTHGLALRVFINGAMGFTYTSNLEESILSRALQDAIDSAKVSVSDEYNGLPGPADQVVSLELFRKELAETPIEKKIEAAIELERVACGYDPKIMGAEEVAYADAESHIYLANSKGLLSQYKDTECYMFLSLLAGEKGEIQTGFSFDTGRCPAELNIKQTAEEAAQKALSLLGARKVATKQVPVVFDSLVAAQFLSVIAQALTAEAVQKGRSLFGDKMGEKVAGESISFVDDGTLERGMASAPFDGEGVPTQRTELVNKGVLRSFLHNTYTAKKGKVKSTGNARRGSFKGTPEVAPSNFMLLPGEMDAEEIKGSVESGFYVTGLQGLHSGANPISGEFSVGATGLWIENGKVAYPVKEVTIAGRMLDMLDDIEVVGNDLRFFPMGGNFGSPTIRFKKMMVAGK